MASSNDSLSDSRTRNGWPRSRPSRGQRQEGIVSPDYAALSAKAMNGHTTSLEFTARYKAWLEYIGPKFWGPVVKADYEKIIAEEETAKQAAGKE